MIFCGTLNPACTSQFEIPLPPPARYNFSAVWGSSFLSRAFWDWSAEILGKAYPCLCGLCLLVLSDEFGLFCFHFNLIYFYLFDFNILHPDHSFSFLLSGRLPLPTFFLPQIHSSSFFFHVLAFWTVVVGLVVVFPAWEYSCTWGRVAHFLHCFLPRQQWEWFLTAWYLQGAGEETFF